MPVEYPGWIADWTERSLLIVDCYRRWFSRDLVDRDGTDEEQSRRLFEAPFVILAHGTQDDPILTYGNRKALEIWELSLEELLQTPSRQTAEDPHREERARLLRRVAADGFIENYSGVRISGSGQRFWIKQATVWNLIDSAGQPAGQAATFCDWEPLGA